MVCSGGLWEETPLESRGGCLESLWGSLPCKNLGFCSSKVGLLLIDEFRPFEMLPSLDCPYPGICPFECDLGAVGLDGILALTSFAYTNIGELSGLVVLAAESFRSNRDGRDEMEDPSPSLITLDALDRLPEVEILSPSPLVARASSTGCSRLSMEETGLELLVVVFEAPFGVDDALSTLALLDPDRGVMLELKKALTGVATSSGEVSFSTPNRSSRPSLRRVEDPLMTGEAAIFAMPLLFPAHLGDCVVDFAMGRWLTMPFCFSEFIAAGPCRVEVAE